LTTSELRTTRGDDEAEAAVIPINHIPISILLKAIASVLNSAYRSAQVLEGRFVLSFLASSVVVASGVRFVKIPFCWVVAALDDCTVTGHPLQTE
jgi:hypothetical protein